MTKDQEVRRQEQREGLWRLPEGLQTGWALFEQSSQASPKSQASQWSREFHWVELSEPYDQPELLSPDTKLHDHS